MVVLTNGRPTSIYAALRSDGMVRSHPPSSCIIRMSVKMFELVTGPIHTLGHISMRDILIDDAVTGDSTAHNQHSPATDSVEGLSRNISWRVVLDEKQGPNKSPRRNWTIELEAAVKNLGLSRTGSRFHPVGGNVMERYLTACQHRGIDPNLPAVQRTLGNGGREVKSM